MTSNAIKIKDGASPSNNKNSNAKGGAQKMGHSRSMTESALGSSSPKRNRYVSEKEVKKLQDMESKKMKAGVNDVLNKLGQEDKDDT